LQHKDLDLKATINKEEAYFVADFVIIATPSAVMIIKSTVPVGFIANIKQELG
jgi:UDPglucose 6-dehydrogenase